MAAKSRQRTAPKTVDKPDALTGAGTSFIRWVKAKPSTRGTACGLGGLYLAGGIFGPVVDPVWMAALAVPVAAIAGINGHKTGGKQWGRVVGAASAAVPSWLALSSVTGIGSWPVLAGYTCVAAGLWAGVATSDVVTAKKRYQLAQAQWSGLAERVGLAGSIWRDQIPNRLGYELAIDVRGCVETASKLIKGDVAERVAAELGLPRHRVRIMPSAKHAGMITIEVIERDPWTTSTQHPLFDASSEIQLPHVRSITDPAGLVIGIDPLTGFPLTVPVWDAEGACNVLIAAAMGAGKTTLVNCIIEQVTSCADALVWMIDVTKAKDARLWDRAVDWTAAGPGSIPAALAMLKAGVDLINTRAEHSTTSIHRPTPQAPAVVIIVDEASGLFGREDDVADRANQLIDFIATKGRSEGVAVIVVGQRGTASHLGKAGLKAAMKTRVLMRVTQRSEMQWIVPGHDEMGLPDMLTYGDGKAGVALVVNTATQQGKP
ncbi:MAG: ATP-binding protein, partial [Angustibacter sp.]